MRHNPDNGIMAHLVDQCAAIPLRGDKRRLRRHLDVVRCRRIESALASEPQYDTAVGEDDLAGLRCTPRRFRERWRHEWRNTVDLAGMEQREGA